MPNRIFREGLLDSEPFNALSLEAELFFVRLMLKADDFGRYTGHPTLLRANLYPLKLDKVREKDIVDWLGECVRQKMVIVYTSGGKSFLEIPKFQQRTRAEKSRFPECPTNDGQLSVNGLTSAHVVGGVVVVEDDSRENGCNVAVEPQPAAKTEAKLSDGEWLESLKTNPAYEGIDVVREHGKMQAWCSTNRKEPTRRRFINWLNRCEKPFRLASTPARRGPNI